MKNCDKALTALMLVFILLGCNQVIEEDAPPPQINSTQLKQTIITTDTEEKIVTGTSIVYCSTFQLAWNELKDNIIKADIRMADEPPIVQVLNNGIATKSDISDKSYVAMAGFAKDGILAKINTALRNKFGVDAPAISAPLNPNDIFAYAFLYKNLQFKYPFSKLDYPLYFQSVPGPAPVKAFGIDNNPEITDYDQVIKQILILDYKNDDDFIIKLLTTSPDDEIILAKVKYDQTLLKTTESVSKRINNNTPIPFKWPDRLGIPTIAFDVLHNYSELTYKPLINPVKYQITHAYQKIRFRINEKGALLKSEAALMVTPAEPDKLPVVAKQLIFNKPFLLCFKEKNGRYPYFIMWVANPELMSKN
jgi:hypothetical protein